MARMVGKTKWHQSCRYGCCVGHVPAHTVKRQEEREWKTELVDELYEDHKHDNGICYNPPGGYGCKDCYFDYDYYDNAELDDVPGVWCNSDYRNDPTYQQILKEEGLLGEQSQTPRSTPERLVSEITVQRVDR